MTKLKGSFFALICFRIDYSVERGECDCERERCICKFAPLSRVRYFGINGAANLPNASDNNCECDPDQCYNPQFPDVSADSDLSLIFDNNYNYPMRMHKG